MRELLLIRYRPPGGVRWGPLMLDSALSYWRVRKQAGRAPLTINELRTDRMRGIGNVGAWIYTPEFSAWRQFRNRRQVAAAVGLCSTLRESGDLRLEQGIGKAGNRYLRTLAIELAWSWLRRQPQSALSRWYRDRFAHGGPQVRRIGIVALQQQDDILG